MRTLIAAALVLFAAPVQAGEPGAEAGRVLQEAGLVGAWAVDCADPNEFDRETIGPGPRGFFQSVMGGDDYLETYDIVAARRLDGGDVEMALRPVAEDEDGAGGGDAADLAVVYRVEGDRQMTWSSIDAGGRPLITDGVLAGDGTQKSLWYHRCDAGRILP